jgi:hypothetical protein
MKRLSSSVTSSMLAEISLTRLRFMEMGIPSVFWVDYWEF